MQNSAYRGVSIITGGPGTGKTRIIEGLVQVLSKEKRSKIRICAPTGRAAKRVAENRALNRFNPSTIHMLLHEVENSSEDLKVDTIIIDEASMIDINLFDKFIEVIPDKAQLFCW